MMSMNFAIEANNPPYQIGDEVIEVNGQSLINVPHREAIKMLKSSQSLMLTIRNRDVSS